MIAEAVLDGQRREVVGAIGEARQHLLHPQPHSVGGHRGARHLVEHPAYVERRIVDGRRDLDQRRSRRLLQLLAHGVHEPLLEVRRAGRS